MTRSICFSILLITAFLFQGTYSIANQGEDSLITINDKKLSKARDYIFDQKLDSARLVLDDVDASVYPESRRLNYFIAMKNIVQSNKADYKDLAVFANFSGNETGVDREKWSRYVDENIPVPTNKKELNIHYFNTIWEQVASLRNYVSVEESSSRQKKLLAYLNQFDPEKKEVIRAKALAKTHDIVLAYIGKDLNLGLQLCHEMDSVGLALNDTFLLIASYYHLSDFLIVQGKLDAYIANCEKGFALDSQQGSNSKYYMANVSNMLNAYIHKGGNEKRIQELFDILNSFSNTKHTAYYLYAQYIKSLPLDSPVRDQIFAKFDAKNVLEFAKNITVKAEIALRNKNLIDFYSQLAMAMLNSGYPKEAFHYKSKSADVTERIYSEKLSNTLAEFKTEQAVKTKEVEIQNEKDKNTLYLFILGLSAMIVLVMIFFILRIQKQKKLLSLKNEEIQQQRDDIAKSEQEKAMLLKEVHHRVKNNFQIISSLLELQTKGIEDEKALELAQEGKNRVQSMALIHQRLYQNDDLLIHFDEYIDKLVQELIAMYGENQTIKTDLKLNNHAFDIDTAIPLGLIVNELVTNAMKYGFNKNEKELSVSVIKEDAQYYKLTVTDNGNGLSEEINLKKVKSLGLRLVRRLAKQLHGELTYSNNSGCSFSITFKDTMTRSLID